MVFRPSDPHSAQHQELPEDSEHSDTGVIQRIAPELTFWDKPRTLFLHNAITGERIRATYFQDGKFNNDEYWKICAFLRDWRQNKMTTMDPGLLDVLRGIQGFYEQAGYHKPIIINSAFRTQKTNQLLAGEGSARNSQHLYGKACDIRIEGVKTSDLARLGVYFQKGGVGFYQSKGFVHLDTGRVRAWRG